MKSISRIITGSIIIIFSAWFIIFAGFIDGPGIDFQAIAFGLIPLVIGVFILLNKKEDKIEEIKNDSK